MTDPRPIAVRPARATLAIVAVALLAVALALYAARRMIAREVLTGWLSAHGVAASARVDTLGLGGVTGRVQVGDPRAPDFVAGDASVTYGLRGLGVAVRSVTLTRPVLRARLRNGELSLGALDPLIEELRKRPPQPNVAQPRVVVDDGLLLLTTDYGLVRLVADLVIEDGKLLSVSASTGPARLRKAGFDATLDASSVKLQTRGDRVDFSFDAAAKTLATGPVVVTAARLHLTGQAPYPDLKRRRGDGALGVDGFLSGQTLTLAGQRVEGGRLSATFRGVAAGWIDTLTATGKADLDLRATAAGLDAARIGLIHVQTSAPDLRWSRKGGDMVSATPRLMFTARDLVAGGLKAPQLSGAFAGPVTIGPQGLFLALDGGAAGPGAWSGLGAPVATDSAQIAAVKRAARDFRIAAPGLRLRLARGAGSLTLAQPVRLKPEPGGEVVLSQHGRGAYSLTVSGGGLPKVDAELGQVSLAAGTASAVGRVRAALSVGPVEGGSLDASGRLELADGAVSFLASRCALVGARRLVFGANEVGALGGRFCAGRGPMLTVAGGEWRLAGQVQGLTAEVPLLQARLHDATGPITVAQSKGRLHASAGVRSAGVEDTAPATRFHPMRLSGTAGFSGDMATADLVISTPAGQPLAKATLRHDSRSGAGGVAIDSGTLEFAEGGLQPTQLSPMAAAIGSPAVGQAGFAGRFAWTRDGGTSSGVVDIPRLDFDSPAGRVTGLSGRLVFSSLSPLTAAPGQVLRADSVAAVAALTGVSATFEVAAGALTISGGEAQVGGGRVTIESLTVPLQAGAPLKGALLFDGVQLHDIVEASPFGDHVNLDARVSGRMPFESQDGKVRILGGDLHAIEPGRLSINRTALSAVAATGAVEAPVGGAAPVAANDTFTDFAYQAMENLAFDKLDAAVATRNDGRLGVLFHIVGRHDPPTHQEIRLSLADLIGRKFLGRKLPLPSDTAVDLTLDTTLNLDDLLADYADYQRLRSSHPVQP